MNEYEPNDTRFEGNPIREVSGENWREILDNINEQPTIQERLREGFPYGHEKFIELSLDEMSLHSQKNYDYAHGGNPLGNFDRVSTIKKLYPGLDWTTPEATALDYALKQQDAVMWQMSQGYEGQVEGIDKKAEDVHVYWKLFRIIFGRRKEA